MATITIEEKIGKEYGKANGLLYQKKQRNDHTITVIPVK